MPGVLPDRSGGRLDRGERRLLALKQVGIPAALRVYANGEHGFGVRQQGPPTDARTEACVAAWVAASPAKDFVTVW